MDLSGRPARSFAFEGLPMRTERWTVSYKQLGNSSRGTKKAICFPPDTKGFFYFCDRTTTNPLAGDVRFRVLPQDAIEKSNSVSGTELFARGYDLLNYDGTKPWGPSLPCIIYLKTSGVYAFMKKQGLIADEAELRLQRLQRLKPHSVAKGVGSEFFCMAQSQVLDQVTSPFSVDLSKYEQRVMILHSEGILNHRFTTRSMTMKHPPPGSSLNWYPPSYSGESPPSCVLSCKHSLTIRMSIGKALVRYEMVRRETEKRDHAVVRILKYVQPPNPGDEVVQKEGELMKQYDPVEKVETVWTSSRKNFLTPLLLEELARAYLSKDSR